MCVIGDECEIKLNYLLEEVFQKRSTLSVEPEFGVIERWAEFDRDRIILTPDNIVEVKAYSFKLKLLDRNGNWEKITVRCAINKPFEPLGVADQLGAIGFGSGTTTISSGSDTSATALVINEDGSIDELSIAEDSTTTDESVDANTEDVGEETASEIDLAINWKPDALELSYSSTRVKKGDKLVVDFSKAWVDELRYCDYRCIEGFVPLGLDELNAEWDHKA